MLTIAILIVTRLLVNTAQIILYVILATTSLIYSIPNKIQGQNCRLGIVTNPIVIAPDIIRGFRSGYEESGYIGDPLRGRGNQKDMK